MALMARFRSELAVTERTREVARIVLRQPAPSLGLMPAQAMTMQAAVALLPGWARRMHGFSMPVVARPLVRAAAFALRSEEHTSELQSLMRISYAVFCLKKKTYTQQTCTYIPCAINPTTYKRSAMKRPLDICHST